MTALATLALAALLATPPAPGAPAPAPPGPCSDSTHRQFDFWLGEWTVETATGARAGENRVTRLLDGCALQEEWTGEGALRGRSLTFYDRTDGLWRQVWVDDSGSSMQLSGGVQDRSMVLTGPTKVPGGTILNRITWTPVDRNRIEQHWQASADGGRSWRDVFWGLYVRKKG